MAIADLGFELLVDFADNGGKPYARRTYALVDTDPATVGAVVTSMIAKIIAATDAHVAAYRLAHVYVEDALTLPASGVQNENQLILTAPIAGDPLDSAFFSIPAAKPTLFTAASGKGANIADMSDATLLAYAGMFDAAVGNEAYISDGEQIDSLQGGGKRRHTKNSNG